MFTIIFPKRMIFLCLSFPLATTLILNLYDISVYYNISLFLYHLINMIVVIQTVNLIGLMNKSMIEKPIMLKLFLCILLPILTISYTLIPLIINKIKITTISMYLLGLLTMFASFNGLFINSEVNSKVINLDNLQFLHAERLNIIWPCIFFFVAVFISTSFIPVLATKNIEPELLYAGICVGGIGFTTLIIIPMDNLRSVREKIDAMKKAKEN